MDILISVAMFYLLLAIYVDGRDSALYPASHCQMVASYNVPIIVCIDTAIIQVSGIYDSRIMAYCDELILPLSIFPVFRID